MYRKKNKFYDFLEQDDIDIIRENIEKGNKEYLQQLDKFVNRK